MTMIGRTDSSGGGAKTGASPDLLGRLLALNRPIVMGILNITPDSFSDGGQYADPAKAFDHAQYMIAAGADIIDIGAESTRPYVGAKPVSLEEELARLAPILPAVVNLGAPVSIDTIKPQVAAWALTRGAAIVNDVWGLQREPLMARVVAEARVPVIVMHNRYRVEPLMDVMADVNAFFSHSLEIAAKAGIAREAIVLDPGVGFGKSAVQSMAVIGRLAEFKRFGRPLMVGASRKRFINEIVRSEPHQRIPGSIAAHLLAILNGATFIRAHDVAVTVQALRVAAAIQGTR
jgi:dihydropteroate synthase